MSLLNESQLSHKTKFNSNTVNYRLCPTCSKTKCYEHCNFCGKKIRWHKDEKGLKWIYEDGTDIVHYNPETRIGCRTGTSIGGETIKNGQILTKFYCDFCSRYYPLDHFCILVKPKPQLNLMCIANVKLANFYKNYMPLTRVMGLDK